MVGLENSSDKAEFSAKTQGDLIASEGSFLDPEWALGIQELSDTMDSIASTTYCVHIDPLEGARWVILGSIYVFKKEN